MVKREQVKAGTTIAVVKKSPGQPGPDFQGTLGIHERLEVLSSPFSKGGTNLVKVRRHKTDQEFNIIYAYVTNFCKVVETAEVVVGLVPDRSQDTTFTMVKGRNTTIPPSDDAETIPAPPPSNSPLIDDD